METAVSALGNRIKEIRKKKKMTLNQVSERSGVSVSTLSKVETGQINGSVDTIFKIARGLGVLFNNLMPSQSAAAAPAGRRVITRRSDAERFPTEIYDYAVHSADLVSKSMVPLLMTIKTRQVPDFCDWSTHGGEEFVFVVRGVIEFHTEHYAPVRLEHGDSVYFDSLMRHAFVTVGGGSEAVIVSVSLSDTRALWDGDEPWRPGLGRVEAGPPRQARDGGSRDVKTNVIKEANMHWKTQ